MDPEENEFDDKEFDDKEPNDDGDGEDDASNKDDEVKNDSGDDDVYSDLSEGGWISWFCGLEGNEFLVEVDEDWIRTDLSLIGIANKFKNYKYTYSLI